MKIIVKTLLAAFVSVALVACSDKTTNAVSNTCTNTYGTNTFKDCRNGQTYKTVVIGTQTWMAQNLNYKPTTAPDSSWCYNDSASYCATYGRLYDYATALTVCPVGWHLPDTTEWKTLVTFVSDTAYSGFELMSMTGWDTSSNVEANNAYGFSALPGGDFGPKGGKGSNVFFDAGMEGDWWTATALGNDSAYFQDILYKDFGVFQDDFLQNIGISVRCLKDSV